ncbi:MAG: long-chain fatty acid--CoA ligase [Deltaproteobacteria bacterium]|nr:long-chain fatty acid--CoA ligase [Deltaproteobacteria bacterium]MBP2677867.1 long-chain fatty acid--CoA ligase [Deltaproteobacteria bacterium]
MFLAPRVGPIYEPLTGRRWGPETTLSQVDRRVAGYRTLGVGRGDRVLLGFGNRLEFFADLLALWHLGACAVPLDSRLTAFEIETLALAAKARIYVGCGGVDPMLAGRLSTLGIEVVDSVEVGAAPGPPTPNLPSFGLDDEALILFTSGTTGNPKGVVHTQRSLRARWMSLRCHLGLEKFRRTLCLLPTHFGHGLICNALFPWLSGQELFILPPFKADTVMRLGHLIDEHRITFLSSSPAVWRLALKTAKPPASGTIERVFVGSAPLSAHLWREIRRWSGTGDVANVYGITETGSWAAGTTVGDFEPEDGLVGVPWGGIAAVTKDGSIEAPPGIGELCSAGESGFVWLNTPALMKGYLDRDELTAQCVRGGWFLTGDLGFLDDRDRLFLRGRVRDEINKGGTKVYPADVEAVAERFPGLNDLCCFAVEDPAYGQNVGMALVLDDSSPARLREIHDLLRRHLADYQMPARLYLVDLLPRTSRGKINRDHIAEICAGLKPVDLRGILSGS